MSRWYVFDDGLLGENAAIALMTALTVDPPDPDEEVVDAEVPSDPS